ncbi:MAG TPA: alpha/beta hydrolase, partial [Candidatus Limnocylindrales bacterium]|nr:alpha/beta hydrolase [Candidatus Limnocylindrales bacterium]
MHQEVAFARSGDGTRIAWARHGHGPPLVRVGTWLTHLEEDWTSPVWRHWLGDLGRRFTVIRYDERGCGLSDRVPAAISFEAWVADLEAVVDAAGVDRFALLGMSQAGAVAIAYARRHPDRVSRLVLYGAYSRGRLARDPTPEQVEEAELGLGLIRVGWGRADPVFRRVFTTSFIPDAAEPQMRWFDELQRRSCAPEVALASSQVRATIDVGAAASSLTVPTLVLHADDDRAVPFEEGRQLARRIPNATFVPLRGHNHILLAGEPAWPEFVERVSAFVTGRPTGAGTGASSQAGLSAREIEVLRLVAEG